MAAPRALNIIKCAVSSFVNFFPRWQQKHEIYTRAVDFRRHNMPYFSLSRRRHRNVFWHAREGASFGIISSPLSHSGSGPPLTFWPGHNFCGEMNFWSCQHFLIFHRRETQSQIHRKTGEWKKREEIRRGNECRELNAHVSPQQKVKGMPMIKTASCDYYCPKIGKGLLLLKENREIKIMFWFLK